MKKNSVEASKSVEFWRSKEKEIKKLKMSHYFKKVKQPSTILQHMSVIKRNLHAKNFDSVASSVMDTLNDRSANESKNSIYHTKAENLKAELIDIGKAHSLVSSIKLAHDDDYDYESNSATRKAYKSA